MCVYIYISNIVAVVNDYNKLSYYLIFNRDVILSKENKNIIICLITYKVYLAFNYTNHNDCV